MLMDLTVQFEETVNVVNAVNDAEFLDFHARRLVEMAGNIIMGYLLVLDTLKDEEFRNSAEIFIKKAKSDNTEKLEYIRNSELKDLGIFKY